MSFKGIIVFLVVCLALYVPLQSQSSVRGTVVDKENGEPIPGANVQYKNSFRGTLSDPTGKFLFKVNDIPPFTIVVSALGFETEEYIIKKDSTILKIRLVATSDDEQRVIARARKVESMVESASKLEESKANSPAAVHKIGLRSILEIPSSDIYYGLNFLPEVQVNTGSISHASLNTRGFAGIQNWRFVEIVDGVELVSPGLNYSIGNIMAPSELDLSHIELQAGPASALYGPNVFNGAMVTTTKSPFDYQGVSAYVKGGISIQKASGSNPYREIGLRFAKAITPEFAIKLNVAYLGATDWAANDQNSFISHANAAHADSLLSRVATHPNFDAVNVYGDDFSLPVQLSQSETIWVNRSGIAEKELIDYRINNFKLNAALHYRINKNLEAIYDGKFSTGDANIRTSLPIPLRDYEHQSHKLELRSGNSYLRSYYIKEDLKNSYLINNAANFLQNQLKPHLIWATEYASAYNGEVPTIPSGDHGAARGYADRDIPNGSTPDFQRLLKETTENPDKTLGGSKYGGNSSLLHVEGNFELPFQPAKVHMQVGGNFRQYTLNSEGNLYNDGPEGFDAPIPIQEYGGYLQFYRFFAGDRLKLQLTSRYDKNENYQGAFTPRASIIFSFDKNYSHFLRLSGQTGFRNPASLESFVRFSDLNGSTVGGAKKNIDAYLHKLIGSPITGTEIFETLVTQPSYQLYEAGGFTDTSVLELANLNYLQAEKIATLSAGYSGRFGKNFTLNVSGYFNQYDNMIYKYWGYSVLIDQNFAFYSNIKDQVTSYGANAHVEYKLPRGFRIWANYDFLDFEAADAISNNPAFIPAFNSPKHRANVALNNRDLVKGVGFTLRYRWSDAFLWQTSDGQGMIDAYSQWDAAVNIRVESIRSFLKIGASNVFNQEYRPIYGGPYIGSLYYVSFTIDELNWEEKK